MAQLTEVVIAGSEPFLASLFAPISQRVGVRPRVASDPEQALALCRRPVRLLVFEFQGESWLALCRELSRSSTGSPLMVAAVPPGQDASREALVAAGVEAAAWSGDLDQFLITLEHALVAEESEAEDVSLDDMAGLPEEATAAPSEPVAPPDSPAETASFVPSEVWPGTVLPAEDAEFLLVNAIGGSLPRAPALRGVTQKVIGALTPLERSVFQGEPTSFDPSVVRRASALRWQLAAAVATLPQPGSSIDSASVAALLAGVDGVLAQLSESVPPESQPSLEPLRSKLVKEAIDFSEQIQRLTPNQHQPVPAGTEARPNLAKAARVLSIRGAEPTPEQVQPSTNRKWLVVLAIVALVTIAYHGYRLLNPPVTKPLPTLPNAPPSTFSLQGQGQTVLIPEAGKSIPPTELERFKAQEEAKGNVVQELGSGIQIIQPQSPPIGEKRK